VHGPQDDDDVVPLYQPFETAIRGFNRRQVLDHLESLDGRIAMVAADRDAALVQVAELSRVLNHLRKESELLEHLRQEAEKATSQVERMLQSPMVEAGARIQRIMQLAEEEAAELKAKAEAAAAELKTTIVQETAALTARAEREAAEHSARAEQEVTKLRARASSETESMLQHATLQCRRLEADAARRREAADQDAAKQMAQRDSEASARIRDNELRSFARLHLILQVVGEQLATRVSAVERGEAQLTELHAQVVSEVAELGALRNQITSQLAATHQLLAEALGQVLRTAVDHSGEPPSPVPIQRDSRPTSQRLADGGTMYLLPAGAEERRLPRGPS
jgi:hypothetical protein